MQRFFACAISVRMMVNGPSELEPRSLSSGVKSENQRGGMIHVSEMMCGTRCSNSSESSEIASEKLSGMKKGMMLLGSEFLKSSTAAQQRRAVDQGDTNRFPS